MKINKKTLRRLNNLKDYCDFDMAKQVATINLRYETVSELIEPARSTKARPVVSEETVQYLQMLVDNIPKEFSVGYSIVIDDYQGYDPKLLIEVIKHSVERSYYKVDDHEMSANVLWTLLAVIGLSIILFRILGEKYQWFGVAGTIINIALITSLEIFSEVFFEESLMFFLISESKMDFFKRKFRRFNYLALKDSKGKTLFLTERSSLLKNWVGISKPFTLAKNYLLSFSFLAAVLTATQSLPMITDFSMSYIGFEFANIVAFLLAIVVMLSNLSYYREKYFLREYALLVSILLCVLEVGIFIASITTDYFPTSILIVNALAIVGSIINVIALQYTWTCRYQND